MPPHRASCTCFSWSLACWPALVSPLTPGTCISRQNWLLPCLPSSPRPPGPADQHHLLVPVRWLPPDRAGVTALSLITFRPAGPVGAPVSLLSPFRPGTPPPAAASAFVFASICHIHCRFHRFGVAAFVSSSLSVALLNCTIPLLCRRCISHICSAACRTWLLHEVPEVRSLLVRLSTFAGPSSPRGQSPTLTLVLPSVPVVRLLLVRL